VGDGEYQVQDIGQRHDQHMRPKLAHVEQRLRGGASSFVVLEGASGSYACNGAGFIALMEKRERIQGRTVHTLAWLSCLGVFEVKYTMG